MNFKVFCKVGHEYLGGDMTLFQFTDYSNNWRQILKNKGHKYKGQLSVPSQIMNCDNFTVPLLGFQRTFAIASSSVIAKNC